MDQFRSGLPDPRDELTVVVGGRRLSGWKDVSISRSLEAFPTTFSLRASDPYPAVAESIPVEPGARVQLFAGPDLVATGWVDRVAMSFAGPAQHDMTIMGRGLCSDLVDCSADLTHAQLVGGQVAGASFADLARRLARPMNIAVRLVGTDPGPQIPAFAVALGETAYEIIDRIAHYARFICWEDANGSLVLDKLGSARMGSALVQGDNVEGAQVTFSIDGRFSDYIVVWNPVARFAELGNAGNQRAVARDPTMPRYRPRVIVSAQIAPDYDLGKARADWELARRIGRSQAVLLSVAGWRDAAGKLWSVNHLVRVDLPALKLRNREWLIGTVTFRKGHGGTHTDMTIMPKEGFEPAPTPLRLFDWQVQQSLYPPTSP